VVKTLRVTCEPTSVEQCKNGGYVAFDSGTRGSASPSCSAELSPSSRPSGRRGAGWTRARLPEFDVQLASPFEEFVRVSLGQRSRNRDQRGAVEQCFPVVSDDRRVALLAGEPITLGGVDPLDDPGAAEIAAHERTISNRRSYPQAELLRSPAASRGRFRESAEPQMSNGVPRGSPVSGTRRAASRLPLRGCPRQWGPRQQSRVGLA
jgi:hypothetical protein